MKAWRSAATAIMVSLLAAAPAAAQEHPQDLLKEAWIKAAWTEALKGERFAREDSWIPRLGGVASSPQKQRDAGGREWTVAELCQPHNCGDNKLVVLIDQTGQTVSAMQKAAWPTRERFFGRPDANTQALLRAALAGNLSRASLPATPAAPTSPAASSAGAGAPTLTLSPSPVQEAAATPAPSGPNGSVEGELSYPSDYIPADMQICGEEIGTKRLTCTSRKINQRNRTRYVLSLPPGEYHIFAQTKDAPGQRAYYSEFVTCGLDAACKSHKPIAVALPPGMARKGINPQDWYAR
ncbi:MAG TPA: Ivy family c-type lysozyme inhibitor [Bosea sp. (in: a-proteobacteria)]|jgi:hypothetical protein|uniref:Ivy family c-type lysozyme inhibitor n=1 Tax=Bosea sp. (in: a-proteobacteria) TaxID=1871050 RepID=UPI002E0D60A1|nr:Ivy family c-type lysozyme inhibitor [Bosea sp. (in: a-proteobacteria)]